MQGIKGFEGYFHRRKRIIGSTFAVVFSFGLFVTFMLPAVYQTSATVLIEGQHIPMDMAQMQMQGAAMGGMVERRLSVIKHMVLSRDVLAELIQDLDLYPRMRSKPIEDLVEVMRSNITVQPIEVETGGGFGGIGPSLSSTIAFTITYEGKDPRSVYLVVLQLVDMFMSEESNSRETQAMVNYTFLNDQLSALQKEMLGVEDEIARFKEEHLHKLPEFMNVNIQSMDTIQKDMEIKQVRLQSAKDRQLYLEGLLATMPESRQVFSVQGANVLTLDERLKSLRNQLLSERATKAEKHPDVRALASEIKSLEKIADAVRRAKMLRQQLEALTTERQSLLDRYTEAHPDVVILDRKIRELTRQIEEIGRLAASSQHEEAAPDNPAYVNTLTQIETVKLEIESTEEELVQLRQKLVQYQKRVDEMPGVEQEYLVLKRRYASLQGKYQETYKRIEVAKETLNLEQQQISEKYSLIEAPSVPQTPVKPKRRILGVLSLLLSLTLGVGAGIAAESLDHSTHNASELLELTGKHVLGVVPYLDTEDDLRRKRRKRLFVTALTVICALALLLLLFLFLSPRSLNNDGADSLPDETAQAVEQGETAK